MDMWTRNQITCKDRTVNYNAVKFGINGRDPLIGWEAGWDRRPVWALWSRQKSLTLSRISYLLSSSPAHIPHIHWWFRIIDNTLVITLRLKCDCKRAETTFRFSAKRTSQFKSAVVSVQSTTGSRGVRISACSEVVWRVLATNFIRQFPLHFPSRASQCAITFQLEFTSLFMSSFPLLLSM